MTRRRDSQVGGRFQSNAIPSAWSCATTRFVAAGEGMLRREQKRRRIISGAMNHSQRAMRIFLLPHILLLCVSSANCAQRSAEPPFTLKHLGPSVWVAINNPKALASSGANAVFVIGEDGVAVIDTFASIEAAKQLLAEIRKVTKAPVKFVINTHHHLDHVSGNGIFVDAGAVGLAQRNVREWIHTENLRDDDDRRGGRPRRHHAGAEGRRRGTRATLGRL